MSKRKIDKLVVCKDRAADLTQIKRRIDLLQRRYVTKTYVKRNYQERLSRELEELVDVFVNKVHEAKKEQGHEVH